MKRLTIITWLLALIITLNVGCSEQAITYDNYTEEYDAIIHRLEKALDKYVYSNLRGYYNLEDFNKGYNHINQLTYMAYLNKIMDLTLYDLEQLANEVTDEALLSYQSDLEYALKDIKSSTSRFLEWDSINTLMPNKSTLYKDVYYYFTTISDPMIRYVKAENQLSDYIKPYRVQDNEDLDLLKVKNRYRFVYTFAYTSSFIAPMKDFTGLHVDPNQPWMLRHNDYFRVYELSFSVLLGFRDFYTEFMPLIDSEIGVGDEDIDIFKKQMDVIVSTYENYFNLRSMYPMDFYTSDEFKSYQKLAGNLRIGYFYDFYEDEDDLQAIKKAYFEIREFLLDEKMRNIMYERNLAY